MSEWENFRPGDEIRRLSSSLCRTLLKGHIYTFKRYAEHKNTLFIKENTQRWDSDRFELATPRKKVKFHK